MKKLYSLNIYIMLKGKVIFLRRYINIEFRKIGFQNQQWEMKIVNKYCSQNLKIARIPLKCIECSWKCQGHICTIQEITTRYEEKK